MTATTKEAMDRIEVNSACLLGQPVIRGTRIMVRNILCMMSVDT
jgi:uncharacterized protein (DUF433 family)